MFHSLYSHCHIHSECMQDAVSVDDERVRELLSRVSGTDLDVIFAPRKEPLTPPHYQLMTKDQLKKVSDCFILCVSLLVHTLCVNRCSTGTC